MRSDLVITVNVVLCAVLFWTCFCRLVRTDMQTRWEVRTGFAVLGAVALALLLAPFGWMLPCLPGGNPGWGQVWLLAAIVLVQGLTARFWRDQVPPHFQRGCQG